MACIVMNCGCTKDKAGIRYDYNVETGAAFSYPDTSFAVISDLHIYNPALGSSGAAFEKTMNSDRKLLLDSIDLLDYATEAIISSGVRFVLIPGDISWGMNFNEALKDFEFIEDLPGNKLISKGNHDYWWDTKSKFEKFCDENGFRTIKMIHNNCEEAGDFIVCASRGWLLENDESRADREKSLYNKKIYDREIGRLKRSLDASKEIQKKKQKIVVAMHYPPFDYRRKPSGFVELMQEYDVKVCVYGHVHSEGIKNAVQGNFCGIEFKLVSSDSMDFIPYRILC